MRNRLPLISPLLAQDMVSNTGQNAFEGQHVVIRDSGVVSLDRGKEMQLGTFRKFVADLRWRKTLVCNNDSFPDIKYPNKDL